MFSSTGVARVTAVLAEAADIKVRQAMATIEIEEGVWALQDLARRAAGGLSGGISRAYAAGRTAGHSPMCQYLSRCRQVGNAYYRCPSR